MPEERFEVGEKEKHYFTVDWNPVSKRMKVELDGETVLNEGFVFSPTKQKFQFDVGASEAHKAEASAGPFSPNGVLVDGRPARPLL